MVLGYLINVYPANTHGFIRREIATMEALGHVVQRYSIRDVDREFRRAKYLGKVTDAADVAERERTRVLLRAGADEVALAVAAALARPRAFANAVRLAVGAGRRSSPGVLRHLAYLAEACVLARWCRRDGVEHLHAHFGSNPATVAMLCHVLGGPRWSFTAHGAETFDAPEFQALDEKVARAAFTVAVSHFGRGQLCRWSAPAHWSRIHVVRCGVDAQLLARPRSPAQEARRLVCVARLSREKGHVSLLHAARRLHEEGRAFELVLVGEGPMRGSLEALVGALGLGAHVRFAGWQDEGGVVREIVASRALVVSSFSEGLPVVLMEAMALGRPCIATQITGIPELVQPGVNGWLVPPSSEEALAAAMGEALDATPAELDRMGRAGADRVAALHDAGTEGARLASLFAADTGSIGAARAERRAAERRRGVAAGAGIPSLATTEPGRASGTARWLAAQLWRRTGRVERNRRTLYGGRTGLRIAVFHGTGARELEQLKRVVEWWGGRWPIATPADVDALVAGGWRAGDADRLLVTFDDGLASNYDAAAWLAEVGVQAVFFVIPSFLDRTVAHFTAYHRERGVEAFPPVPDGEALGLSTSQVREMLSMGHRVGAHNDAHRDLGQLHEPDDLRYEIRNAIERISELTGAPCRDFAVGFGQPRNLSAEAVAQLRQSCPNVYMCHRGLNAPGLTPRFLLRHASAPGHPLAFTQICLEGGADHRLVDRALELQARVGLLPSRPAKAVATS